MIVTKQWLNEWIDLRHIETDRVVIALNAIGLEVDGVHKVRIPEHIVVGKVVSCEKHPNADKLSVTHVDVGAQELLQIVCGASNVAAGQMVAVALIGAKLPSGLEIKKAKLRDVQSCGMLCSSSEIGLPKLNDGIMLLDNSIGELILGKPLCEYPLLNDDIIEIGLTPNRGDCQSVYGVARDLSVFFDAEVIKPSIIEDEENKPGIGRVLQVNGAEGLDGNYMYKVFDNESMEVPLLIDLRLAYAEMNNESLLGKLIDYATYVSGVLLRAYSHPCFAGSEAKAKITIAKDEHGLDAVFNKEHQVAITGIAQSQECKASALDSRIIIEANYTHPTIIAEKSANLKLGADRHLYRSSRGSEPDLNFGLNYFFKTLLLGSRIVTYADTQHITKELKERVIVIHQSELTRMIGEEIPKNKVIKILRQLGFDVHFAAEQDVINAKVPAFRADVTNVQDICEEIVRIVGIDNIMAKPYSFAEKSKINQPYLDFKKRQMYRHKAVAIGFFETLHFVFDDAEKLKRLGFPTLSSALDIANPITSELNTLRSSLLPNIIHAISQNIKFGKKRVGLFEIGSVFDANRVESKKMAFVFSGDESLADISNHGKPVAIDFFSFARKIQSAIGLFELKPLEIINGLCSPYEAASIIINGRNAGYMARVNRHVENEFDLPRTYVCELDFDALDNGRKYAKEYSKFPFVSRDLSLMVPSSMQYGDLEAYMSSIAPKELIKCTAIDTYAQESFGELMSLTLRLQFQSFEKTLEEENIVAMIEMLLKKLHEKFGITLR